MSSTDDSVEVSVLARAPRAAAYLRELARRPKKRPVGSHSGAFLRLHELIDEEVKTADGRRLTAAEAALEFGDAWYTATTFTGRERVTAKGKAELAKLKAQA
jgi:hypothetical protein